LLETHNLEDKAMPWALTGNAIASRDFLGTTNDQPLVVKANNIEAMRIEPDGKVGIGTAGPNAPLQIGSDTYTQDSKIILDAGNGAQRRAWSMRVPYGDTTVTSPNYGFVIRDETGGTDRFVIDWQTGNVGIGTTGPNAPLQIGSDTYTQDSKIILDAGNGAQRRAWSMRVPYGDTTVTSPNYGFVIRDETGGTDRFVIDWQTGNVGIGTTSPLHMLQVGGGFDGNLGLDGSDGSPNAGYIRFGDTTGWKLHFTRQRETSGGDLNTGATGALVTIQDNGNVGIGTTFPGSPLDVGGDARIAGVLWGNHGDFSNDVNADRIRAFGHLSALLLTATIKLFRIDHPLDPANKYLSHASVESPDLKTFYDGIAELDTNGEAVVELPGWFEALNKDFRYQLTGIGGFAPTYIAEEITNNRFKIAGGNPGMKVCWQVTSVRHDAVVQATPMVVEEDKPEDEKGYYQNPEAHGQPEEMGIRWKREMERSGQAASREP
jgi:hypothetical protein